MPSPTFAGRVHGLFALLALALLAPFSRAVDNVGVVVPTTGLSPALVAGKSLAEKNRDFGVNPAGFSVDLRSYFTIPGLLGGGRELVQFKTSLGVINAEFLADGVDAGAGDLDPDQTVANFKSYLATDATPAADKIKTYDGSFLHRLVPAFALQGGGYRVNATPALEAVTVKANVVNEFHYANTRGTLAMAKRDGAPDSANSQWFFNLVDNRDSLDNQNGGFTAFARVLGKGMEVVDRISALPRPTYLGDNNTLYETPLRNWSAGADVLVNNLVYLDTVRLVPLQPPATGTGPSVLVYALSNDNPVAATATLANGLLTITPGAKPGRSIFTVRAAEAGGAFVESTLTVLRNGPATIIKDLPATTTAALGASPVLNADVTGWPLAIKWQRRPSATAAWIDIPADDARFSGATTEDLTIKLTGATPAAVAQALALAGNQFRYLLANDFAGPAAPLQGKPTALKITTAFAFQSKLAATTTAALGATITLSNPVTAATYPAPTYRWERRASATAPWQPVVNSSATAPVVVSPHSGATTANLVIRLNGETPAKSAADLTTAQTLALDRSQFRCVVTQDRGAGPTRLEGNPTTLRITTMPVGFATQPPATFDGLLATSPGTPPTTTLSIAAQPAAANTPVRYQWQARARSAAPDAWVNLVNNATDAPTPYLGVTTATLTLRFPFELNFTPGFGFALDGTDYRCVLTNALTTAAPPFGPAAGTATSKLARLRVIAGIVTLATAESFRFPGQAEPAPGRTFAVTGLPAGLALDPATGIVSGTPTAKPGIYAVTLSTREGPATQSFVFNVQIAALFNNVPTGFEALLAPAGRPPVAKLALLLAGDGNFTGTLTTAEDAKPIALKGAMVRDTTTGDLSFKAPLNLPRLAPAAGRFYVLSDFLATSETRISVALRTRASATASPVDYAAATYVAAGDDAPGNPGVQLASYSTASAAPWANVNSYHLALTTPVKLATTDARPIPAGSGYATAPITADGKLAFTGKLADGEKFTASVAPGADATYRLFLRPYAASSGAVLAAQLPLTPASVTYLRYSIRGTAGEDVHWTKPALPKTALYRAGFGPLGLTARLEPWYPEVFSDFGVAQTSDTTKGKTDVALSGAPLGESAAALPTALSVTYGSAAKFVDLTPPDASIFTGTMSPAKGTFTGSFILIDPVPGSTPAKTTTRKVPFEGVLLMAETLGAGTVTAEGFTLVPAAPGATSPEPVSGRIQFKNPAP